MKWIGFDAFYGRDTSLLAELVKQGQEFVADVPDSLHIWLMPFDMQVPEKTSGKGRRPTRLKPTKASVSIKDYCDDVACWDLNDEGKLVIIHDYASVGYELVKEYNTFWDWFRDAINDMIDFINDEIE